MAETATAEAPSTAEQPAAFDYSSLIAQESTPDTPPPAAIPAAEKAEPSAEAEATAEVTDDTTPAESKAPADGTADKHRQKIDQRIAALEKIAAKMEAGTATAKEVAQFEVKKDELADMLEADKETPESDRAILAKRVLHNESKQAKEIEALREELRTEKAARIWEKQENRFPGIDVRKIWENSAEAAKDVVTKRLERAEVTDLPEDQLRRLIYAETLEIYETRADTASKSVKAKAAAKEPAPVVKPKTAPVATPATTPSGARVTVSGSSSAVPKPAGDHTKITAQDYRNLYEKE